MPATRHVGNIFRAVVTRPRISYDEAVEAAVTVLEAIREAIRPNNNKKDAPTVRSGSGVEFADIMIKAVRGDPDAPKNPFTKDASEIRALLGHIAERMTVHGRVSNPFHLALAVFETTKALEDTSKARTASGSLPKETVVRILKGNLRNFLRSDWQVWKEGYEAREQKEFEAAIRRRADDVAKRGSEFK